MADKKINIDVLVKHSENPDISIFARVQNFAAYYKNAFLKHPVILAIVGLVYGAWKAITYAQETEESINGLNQALINQGIYSRALSQSYQDMANGFSIHSKFSNEEIIAAQATLQPFLGTTQISKDLMKAVIDFATAKKKDLSQAALMVGKSIDTAMNPLKGYGVKLSESLSPTEKLTQIIEQLNGHYVNQGEAFTKGLGALHVFKNKFGDIMSLVGISLAPIVQQINKVLIELSDALSKNASLIDSLGTGVLIFQGILIVLKNAMTYVIGDMLGLIKRFSKTFYNLFQGKFLKAYESFMAKSSDNDLLKKGIIIDSIAEIKEILAKRQNESKENKKKSQRMTKDSTDNLRDEVFEKRKMRDDFFKTKSKEQLISDMTMLRLRKDSDYMRMIERLKTEKDITKRHEIEKQLGKKYQETRKQAEIESNKTQGLLNKHADESQFDTQKKALDQLSQLQASKAGTLVAVGKTAAIASIIVDTAIGIPNTAAALAMVFPPAYPIILPIVAVALSMFAEEQIFNIIDSSLESPGRIAFKTVGKLLNMISAAIRYVGEIIKFLLDVVGDVILGAAQVFQAMTKDLASALRNAAPVIGHVVGAVLEVAGFIVNIVGEIVNAILDIIGEIISAVASAISAVFDFLFGWLFAEGGAVVHSRGIPEIIPLREAGISLTRTINVRIVGGLVPSRHEIIRLAETIRNGLKYG